MRWSTLAYRRRSWCPVDVKPVFLLATKLYLVQEVKDTLHICSCARHGSRTSRTEWLVARLYTKASWLEARRPDTGSAAAVQCSDWRRRRRTVALRHECVSLVGGMNQRLNASNFGVPSMRACCSLARSSSTGVFTADGPGLRCVQRQLLGRRVSTQ